MMIKQFAMYKFRTVLFIAIAVLAFSCKREFDEPPLKTIPEGNVLTISELRGMYQGGPVKFEEDYSVYAVVTMDEESGNIYKESYIQDATGAIQMRLQNTGGLYVGDSIRVNLKGTVLGNYRGMMQLDSVDVDNNIVKQETNQHLSPEVVNINDLDSSYQAKLIKLEGVQFSPQEFGLTFADAVEQQSENRTLIDCDNNHILVRTSGYADFAGELIPEKKGSLVAIVGQFDDDLQLYIRNTSELVFNDPLCRLLVKTFEDDDLNSGGWTTQVEVGTADWETGVFNNDIFAKITNYDFGTSTNNTSEAWLISPAVDLSNSNNPVFSFENAYKYNGDPLETYVSVDYDGTSSPSTATWDLLNPTLSSGGFTWVNSGDLDLSSYKASNVYVAFKYSGSNSDGSTWEVDDIIISEK